MPAADIVNIVSTVAVVQGICDLVANRVVFSSEAYQKLVSRFESAQFRRDKIAAEVAKSAKDSETTATSPSKKGSNKADRDKKRLERATDEAAEAAAQVASKHASAGMMVSIVFLLLFRIFSAEYSGKVLGVLPFLPPSKWPFRILRLITSRGLDFGDATLENVAQEGVKVTDTAQAFSFVCIYILSAMSVKFYVHKMFGTPPPPGADGGLTAVLDTPQGKKWLRSAGFDPDELKEMRS